MEAQSKPMRWVFESDDTLRWDPGPGTAALDLVVGEVVERATV